MERHEIERLLPRLYQSAAGPGTPLTALLEVMVALHAPAEERLAHLPAIFSPWQTPDRFVPYLASWVDLDRFFPPAAAEGRAARAGGEPISTGTGRLRELIGAAAYLSQWRGTSHGLCRFLQTATGAAEFRIDEQVEEAGEVLPYHIRVTAPASCARHRALIERIIEQEKPAYVTYELEFG